MSLFGWLHRNREAPISPVPEAAREVQRQAIELSRIAQDLRYMQDAKDRKRQA